MKTPRVPPWLWAAAFAPRLILCALAWADTQLLLEPDSGDYLKLAFSLWNERNFVIDGRPDTFRTPGYPLFLAAFHGLKDSPLWPAAFVQSLLGGFGAVLIWRWLSRSADTRAAAVAAAALSLDLVTVLHTPLILTETLFLSVITAALISTWESLERNSARKAGLSGLLWGLCALIKPIAFYLPVLLSVLWWRRKKTVPLFLLAAYLLPGLWMMRNKFATGTASLSSIQSLALLAYPASGVEALRTGRNMETISAELISSVDQAYPAGPEREKEYGRLARGILIANPVLLLRYCAFGSLKVLGGTGLEMLVEWVGKKPAVDAEFKPQVSGQGTLSLMNRYPWLIPIQLAYMAALAGLYLMWVAGVIRLWRAGQHEQALLLLGGALYFLALSSTQGYYRYRIPLMPFLAVSAGLALKR